MWVRARAEYCFFHHCILNTVPSHVWWWIFPLCWLANEWMNEMIRLHDLNTLTPLPSSASQKVRKPGWKSSNVSWTLGSVLWQFVEERKKWAANQITFIKNSTKLSHSWGKFSFSSVCFLHFFPHHFKIKSGDPFMGNSGSCLKLRK